MIKISRTGIKDFQVKAERTVQSRRDRGIPESQVQKLETREIHESLGIQKLEMSESRKSTGNQKIPEIQGITENQEIPKIQGITESREIPEVLQRTQGKGLETLDPKTTEIPETDPHPVRGKTPEIHDLKAGTSLLPKVQNPPRLTISTWCPVPLDRPLKFPALRPCTVTSSLRCPLLRHSCRLPTCSGRRLRNRGHPLASRDPRSALGKRAVAPGWGSTNSSL